MGYFRLPASGSIINVYAFEQYVNSANSTWELDELQAFVSGERNKVYAARVGKIGLTALAFFSGRLFTTWNPANNEKLDACNKCDELIRKRRQVLG